jgi:hypothetical protein
MAKIQKHAEFLDQLRGMVTTPKTAEVNKEAEKPTATGKPGADTHFVAVSDKTEHVNKNEQGHPEHNPQEFKQEKAKDPSDPSKKHAEEDAAKEGTEKEAQAKTSALPDTKKAPEAAAAPNTTTQKKAEEAPVTNENTKLAELGAQILAAVQAAQTKQAEQTKEAEKPTATGKPGKDTQYQSTSDKTEHVNKNEEGKPENNPQEFKQEKAKDPSDPTKKHAEEVSKEDLEKDASFELGRQFTRAFVTQFTKQASVYKEAGRRDFETLIAQAAQELDQEKQAQNVVKQAAVAQPDHAAIEKQAEEAGAQAFHTLLKQAEEEYQQAQIKQAFEQRIAQLAQEKEAAEKRAAELNAKLIEKEAAMQKKAEEEKRAAEFAQWSNYTVEQVIERLKSEPTR